MKQTYWCLWFIHGVNDCNEWKTEKCHECTNIGKLQRTQVMKATVHNVASGSGLGQFQAT